MTYGASPRPVPPGHERLQRLGVLEIDPSCRGGQELLGRPASCRIAAALDLSAPASAGSTWPKENPALAGLSLFVS